MSKNKEHSAEWFDIIQTSVMVVLFLLLIVLTFLFFYNKSLRNDSTSNTNSSSVLLFDDSTTLFTDYNSCEPSIIATNLCGDDIGVFSNVSLINSINKCVMNKIYSAMLLDDYDTSVSYDDFIIDGEYLYFEYTNQILIDSFCLYNFSSVNTDTLLKLTPYVNYIYIKFFTDSIDVYVGYHDEKVKFKINDIELKNEIKSLVEDNILNFYHCQLDVIEGLYFYDNIVVLFSDSISVSNIVVNSSNAYLSISKAEHKKLLEAFSINVKKARVNDSFADSVSYIDSFNTLIIRDSITYTANENYGIDINVTNTDLLVNDYLLYIEKLFNNIKSAISSFNSIELKLLSITENNNEISFSFMYTIDNIVLCSDDGFYKADFKFIDNRLVSASIDYLSVYSDNSISTIEPSFWRYNLMSNKYNVNGIFPAYVINNKKTNVDWIVTYTNGD